MVVRLARQEFEREAGALRSRSMAGFVGWSVSDDRVEPLPLQGFAVELSLPAGRREIALSERKKWLLVLGGASVHRCDRWLVIKDGFSRRGRLQCARRILPLEVQAYAVLALQSIARNPLEPRVGRSKGAVDHGIDGFAEAFVFKTHAPGERAEHLDIGAAFADRIHRLIGDLEVVMAVSRLQIFV